MSTPRAPANGYASPNKRKGRFKMCVSGGVECRKGVRGMKSGTMDIYYTYLGVIRVYRPPPVGAQRVVDEAALIQSVRMDRDLDVVRVREF